MLTSLQAGDLTVRGLSLGGIYTSLQVPELHLVFDAGAPARSFAAARTLILSHGHADHIGALVGFLGLRALMGSAGPLRVVMPAEIVDPVERMLAAATEMQRYDLGIEAIGMRPGDEYALSGDLQLRALRTYHPVPSLAYLVLRRVPKLRSEFRHLPGHEIGQRRRAGEDLFDWQERIELGYATDTLVQVLDNEPDLLRARVLILECTFLDERKPVAVARAGCHIHLDEILERAEAFENEHLILMHFSQIYRPAEIPGILDARVPPPLRSRMQALVPKGAWPG